MAFSLLQNQTCASRLGYFDLKNGGRLFFDDILKSDDLVDPLILNYLIVKMNF